MPNYTFYRLDVSGSDQALIDSLFAAIALPPDEAAEAEAECHARWLDIEDGSEEKTEEPWIPDSLYFDYNRVIPMPPHLREPPDEKLLDDDSSSSTSLLWKLGSMLFSPIRWYNRQRAWIKHESEREIWIEENWGAGCEEPLFTALYNFHLRRDQAREGNTLRFFTGQGQVPIKVIERLVELYPTLKFEFGYFSEGMDEDVGLLTGENGVSTLDLYEWHSEEARAIREHNGAYQLVEDDDDDEDLGLTAEAAATTKAAVAAEDQSEEESKHSISISTRT